MLLRYHSCYTSSLLHSAYVGHRYCNVAKALREHFDTSLLLCAVNMHYEWPSHSKMFDKHVPLANEVLQHWCNVISAHQTKTSNCDSCHSYTSSTTGLTLSPRKAEKLASPTVTNSHKAKIPTCRYLIYSHKAEIWAWKFREKKLFKIMLCLGTPCCGSSGVRGLRPQHTSQWWQPSVLTRAGPFR